MGKIKVYTGVLAFLAIFLIGAGTSDDKFNIGTGSTTTNKELRLGTNHVLRSDITGGDKLQFSNNAGADWKDIGSGGGSGGGGTNSLQENNPDFESGTPPTDWTASGGTFSSETTTPLFGSVSASWDASALAQTLDSVLAPITEGFVNGTCQAEIEYRYAAGAGGDYKLVVRQYDDSGATEITVTEVDLEVTGATNKRKAQLFFDCPNDVADDLRVRIEAGVANPGIILIDDAFIGTGRNTFHISQTEIYGTYVRSGDTFVSCWIGTTSGTYGDMTLTTPCGSPVVTEKALVPATNVAGVNFAKLPPGKYRVQVTAGLLMTASTVGIAKCAYRLYDGVSGKGDTQVYADVTEGSNMLNHAEAIFEYATEQTDITFRIQAKRVGGDQTCFVSNDQPGRDLQFTVTRYPLNPAEAITLETSGWHIDANMGGANPGLSGSSQTTYTAIDNASLDLVINTSKGSADAEIGCITPNTPTGLTCSVGNESVAIAFTPLQTGRYKVCAAFTHQTNVPINTSMETSFQLVETSLTSDTIVQEGGDRTQDLTDGNATTGVLKSVPYKKCGSFQFNTVGKKLIRLMYEQVVAGGVPATNLVLADRGANTGQRDIHWTVEKMDQQFPTPVFTDLQNSLDSKPTMGSGELMCRFTLTMSTNTITNDTGCVDSVTHTGVGDDTVNFNSGFWTSTPRCIAGAGVGSGDANAYTCMTELSPTTSAMIVIGKSINSGGTGTAAYDTFCDVICFGQ